MLMKSSWSVDRLVQLLGEAVHRESVLHLAVLDGSARATLVDEPHRQLRDRLEAVRAVAVGVGEGHVGAVVGAVDVLAVPAALEGEGAHHVAARPGRSGTCSVSCTVSSKPVQLQCALALARPLVKALASPVMMRRNCGIAMTLLLRAADVLDLRPAGPSGSCRRCPPCHRRPGSGRTPGRRSADAARASSRTTCRPGPSSWCSALAGSCRRWRTRCLLVADVVVVWCAPLVTPGATITLSVLNALVRVHTAADR